MNAGFRVEGLEPGRENDRPMWDTLHITEGHRQRG